MLARTVVILGFCFVILYPIINMMTRALMLPRDLYDNSVLWVPRNFSLANVKLAARAINYWGAFSNSLWSSSLVTLLQLFSCLTAGYAFGRYKLPFRRVLFALVILTLIIPPQLIMVPSYLNFRYFDIFGIYSLITGTPGIPMLDTSMPMILLALTGNGIRNGLFIFLFRQFFVSVPKEIEEAAMVDGAGHFRTFFKIMLPQTTTITVTVALFSFVWQWNDKFYTSLYNRLFETLPNAVTLMRPDLFAANIPEYVGFSLADPVIGRNLSGTAVLLAEIPLILLFLFLQRYFVTSVERSGVVG